MPTNRKKRNRNRQKCPRGLWQIFIDDPLPPGHPEYNRFYELVTTGEWADHKKEVLKYWIEKKVPRGKAKAIFLRRKGLLTPDELLKIKKSNEVKTCPKKQ